MNVTTPNIDSLIDSLKKQTQALQSLNSILSEELNCLKESQFTRLEQYAEQKEILAKSIEQSSRDRLLLLKDLGQSTERNALEEFIKTCSPSDRAKLEATNNQLVEEIAKCQELNSINGQVITHNLNQRRELFRQINSNGSTDIYTKTGNLSKHSDKGLHDEA